MACVIARGRHPMPALPRSFSTAIPARAPLFWQLQLLGWGGFTLVSLPLKEAVYGSFEAALLISAYQLPLSIGLTCLLRAYYRRAHPGQRHPALFPVGVNASSGP